jgi:plastocyanin
MPGMTRHRLLPALLLFSIVAAAAACDDTMTGPSATPTPTGRTPTPSAAHNVLIGRNASGSPDIVFLDPASGTSTSTIRAGEAIQWIWASGSHSTTSGVCPLGCIPDGQWDSGIGHGTTFQHTFPVPGTFPYFCSVHGPMMQGKVIVQ